MNPRRPATVPVTRATCNRCGAVCGWLKSKAGKPYLVNAYVVRDQSGEPSLVAFRTGFHRCATVAADLQAEARLS